MGSSREQNPSLWIATSPPTDDAHLVGDLKTDVVVIGAGISGLTTARLLVDSGMSVVVVDAGDLCAGATGYTTAKVTSLHSAIYTRLTDVWGSERAGVYATANEAAIARVRDLVVTDSIDCGLENASAYTYTETDPGIAVIEREAEAARSAGLAATVTVDTDLPYPVRCALRVDDQAQFHPRKYCLGLASAVRRAGGSVFDHTRAIGIEQGNARVTTDRGVIDAEFIVIATQIPFSDAGGHFARMAPKRSYAVAFEAVTPRPRGMYISIDDPARSVRSTADNRVIVGGEGHKVGADPDTTRRYAALEAWAGDRFGARAIEHRWSAQDYESTDGLPFIGRLRSGSERVFVATGFGKWGMTNGTVAAMIITDAIRGVPNAWADTFDSTRLAAKQGARGVVIGGLDVAKHFVADRAGSIRPPDAESLAPGCGGIARLAGRKVAACKDDSGALHAVSAICTHLGCQVAFNTAERTWDCPCHGSRFDVDGQLLQGPATKNLASVTERTRP